MFTGDVAHASRGSVQVRINPRVAWIEPNTEMTVFAPRRSRWLNSLKSRVGREVFARRRQAKILFDGGFANELFQKMRGMRLRGFFRRFAIVQFLFFTASGNAMIFHTGEFSLAARDWPQMLH